MHVVITGGAGFLGARLAAHLLQRGTLRGGADAQERIERITLVDMAAPQGPADPRIRVVTGDIADASLWPEVFGAAVSCVFHLAAVVSGQAERDFDLGMRVNVDAARQLLEACRALGSRPRVIFTSSVAVYGGALPAIVQDATALLPQSSYGAQKAIAELLLADYSRKGFVDGRIVRLPTISVRPGRPNLAASSFASGIVREPLNGEATVCPVAGGTRLWLMSPRKAIESLVAIHEVRDAALGTNRAVNLPGISVSVDEMVAALRASAGEAAVARIRWQRDPAVERIVGSWPAAWDCARATSLGLSGDPDFAAILRAYVEDDLEPRHRDSLRPQAS